MHSVSFNTWDTKFNYIVWYYIITIQFQVYFQSISTTSNPIYIKIGEFISFIKKNTLFLDHRYKYILCSMKKQTFFMETSFLLNTLTHENSCMFYPTLYSHLRLWWIRVNRINWKKMEEEEKKISFTV